ncbi:MAG: hypothetical protein ACFCVE_07585 [Phycisphaerae bacterium]
MTDLMNKWTKRLSAALFAACVAGMPVNALAETPAPTTAPAGEAAPAAEQANGLPAAREVIDRHIEATGGKEAFANLKSMHMRGTMTVPEQNLRGTLEVWQKPGKMLSIFEIPQLERQMQGLIDGVAWETSVNQGSRLIEGNEKAALQRSNDMQVYLHPEKYYSDMQTVRTDQVDGKKAFVVKMTPKVGEPEIQYFDAETGRLVKSEMVADSPMGRIPMTVTYDNYKPHGPITMSTRQVISFGPARLVSDMSEVELNVDIPDEKFAPPAEIKAMMK